MFTIREAIENPSLLSDLKKETEAETKRIESLENDYWARIGELVEDHPIICPQVRRG